MWVWILGGIVAVTVLFLYALARTAAETDLRIMAAYASKPRKATDPWEEPKVGGGIYDHEQRGDFRGRR